MREPQSSNLLIRCFGSFDVQVNGVPLRNLRSRKGRLLLAYLALHHGREVERDHIAAILWPESDGDLSHNLRRTLTDLREAMRDCKTLRLKCIGKRALRLDLTAEEGDIVAFDALSRRRDLAALETMAALHTAELLAGWGAAAEEHWVLPERQKRIKQYTRALRLHCQEAIDTRLGGRATEYLNTLASLGVVEEALWQRLMLAQNERGEHQQARATFDAFKDHLQRLFGTEPTRESRDLYRTIPQTPRAETGRNTGRTKVVNLPAPLTRFFGRERELAGIRDAICRTKSRLVTLTGPGGIGKSRLAMEAAPLLSRHFGGHAWFLPLTESQDASALLPAIRRALPLSSESDQTSLGEVIRYFNCANGPSLLILDNFEHLVTRGAPLLQLLLQQAPSLTCLITSRLVLGIPGERLFCLDALPFPKAPLSPETALSFPSVRLFVDRAQGINPAFEITQRNADSVASLCARLEGIPLALELAAAWARVYTPQQMLEQLNTRFAFLVAAQNLQGSRHPSLQAALAWSYDLLPPELQALYVQLSVFHGSWTLAAAVEVCDPPAHADSLNRLAAHSIVQPEEVDGEIRWKMLETLREFAQERLSQQIQDEARNELSSRHAAFYDALILKAGQYLIGLECNLWLDRIERDFPNIKAAIVWQLRHSNTPHLLVHPAFMHYHVRLDLGAQCRWLRELLPTISADYNRALVLQRLGSMSVSMGNGRVACCYLLKALKLFRRAGNGPGELGTLTNLEFQARMAENHLQALSYARQTLALARELNLPAEAAKMNARIAHLLTLLGQQEESRAAYEAARAQFERLGDRFGCAQIVGVLGDLACTEGDLPAACSHYEDSLGQFRALGEARWSAIQLLNLGRAWHGRNELDRATTCLQESLAIFEQYKDLSSQVYTKVYLAYVTSKRGEAETAGLILGEAERLSRQSGQMSGFYSPAQFGDLWHSAEFQAARVEDVDRIVDVGEGESEFR